MKKKINTLIVFFIFHTNGVKIFLKLIVKQYQDIRLHEPKLNALRDKVAPTITHVLLCTITLCSAQLQLHGTEVNGEYYLGFLLFNCLFY